MKLGMMPESLHGTEPKKEGKKSITIIFNPVTILAKSLIGIRSKAPLVITEVNCMAWSNMYTSSSSTIH